MSFSICVEQIRCHLCQCAQPRWCPQMSGEQLQFLGSVIVKLRHVDVNRRLGYGWNSWAVLICGYIDDGRWLGYRWNFWSMLSCGHWWWQMAGGRYGWRTLALSHLGKKCQTAWKHHLSNENCRSVIMSEIYLKISGNILHFLDC